MVDHNPEILTQDLFRQRTSSEIIWISYFALCVCM